VTLSAGRRRGRLDRERERGLVGTDVGGARAQRGPGSKRSARVREIKTGGRGGGRMMDDDLAGSCRP
jgi:hypothetical protein